MDSIIERFWSKVQKGPDCWLWTGAGKGDYGRILIGSRTDGTRKIERATRVAWMVQHGLIPEGKHVLHKCDNPGCVREDHLFLGNPKENALDRVAKGRQSHVGAHPGKDHHFAKLTEEKVVEIMSRYAAGDISQEALGVEFGVSQTCISKIVRGTRWKGLDY